MSPTFLATLQFNGGGFVGWQRQANGRSVQGEVERVLERLAGRRVVATGAGRTDAGVHALGMPVSFSLPKPWEPTALRRALNALLPDDCWVAAVHRMRDGFQARKAATGRRYRYDIGTDDASFSPFRRPYEWALGRALEPERLATAAAPILGEHDFRAFALSGQEKPHYRCTIREARWEPRPDGMGYRFHIAADRFLHQMVRMLVGTMVDIGLGRRDAHDMALLLARTDNSETSAPAPPQGLYFLAAEYPAEWYLDGAPA